MLNHFDSRQYSRLVDYQVVQGELVSEITLSYQKDQQIATVKVRLVKGEPLMEWQVTLAPLPKTGNIWVVTDRGLEVTVNF